MPNFFGRCGVSDPTVITPGPGIPSGLWYKAGEGVRIHPTAIVEQGVILGRQTSVWDSVHIRRNTRIGEECIVGEKTYIAYNVRVGNRCKINSFVYICTAVTIEDGVMISAGTVFTNDRFPRATTPDLLQLRGSEVDDQTLPTLVREGATIGANCTIGNDLTIGRWAMVGMGSVVTKSVPDFSLVLGIPAAVVGLVCRCGQLLTRHAAGATPHGNYTCSECAREYETTAAGTIERHGRDGA
jgi:UDP-2-acetamido-3-amino-2,3-dideoxy-glucuronate N-acetyltransferase